VDKIRAENTDASYSVPVVEQYPDRGQTPVEVFRGWCGSTGGAVVGRGEGCGFGFPCVPNMHPLVQGRCGFSISAWGPDSPCTVAIPHPMSYNRKPVDDKIESYLRSIDHSAKAREIAEAIDYHPSYVGKRCRVMSEADITNRQEGGFIIGHDIPGRDNPTILNSDRSYLLSLVKEHEPDRLSKARSMSVKELQKFIKHEIATSTYPLGNKTVSYSLG